MGILAKLGWRHLRTTRGRTALTIGAMGLAATLAMATLVGLRSFQTSFYQYELRNTGGMVAAFPATTPAKAAKLRANAAFDQTISFVDAGRATIGTTKTDSIGDPFRLTVTTPAATAALKPMLVNGRLPRKASEVLLSDMLVTAHRNIGQRIQVTVAGKTQRFRIVGTTNGYGGNFLSTRGVLQVVPHLPAGRTVVMASLKSPWQGHQRLQAITKQAGLAPRDLQVNLAALTWMWGAKSNDSQAKQIAVVGTILAIVGAVALIMIYTSINLSVRANRQRYGLLRSIGTTPRQVRHLVYGEALMLALPALGLGAIFGIGGLGVAIWLMNGVLSGNELPITLVLTVDWVPLLAVVVFMALITLLAAARPAWRASRVTPIAAIRALNISPQLTRRKLRQPWWVRRLPDPMMRLAAKLDRREGRRATMLTTLVVTVTLFVGLTGFIGNAWRHYDTGEAADIRATLSRSGDQTAAMRHLADRLDGVKQAQVTRQAQLSIQKGPRGSELTEINLLVVPDRQAQRDYGWRPTLLNTKALFVDADGRRHMEWQVDPTYSKPLRLIVADQRDSKAPGLSVRVRYQPLAKDPVFSKLLFNNGRVSLVVSDSQYQRWAAALRVPDKTLESVLYVKLARPSAHTAVVKAIKAQFGQIAIMDAVADNQQQAAVVLVMKATAYGFIGLLALVCLAIVVNHTFANLMRARRGLAMLQSIGMTPRQVVAMQAWQYATLLVAGWLGGSILGTGISSVLYRLSASDQPVALIIPWGQIAAAGAVLLLVGVAFIGATWRLLTHQDLERLLRAE
ncbi:ABC transporter permease [Lacticaseibacillus daqingensis]|uniref:ABC transporter permease n=1 Tax=Lacticaseibacillus daqingensis TaxID=2486014 RepID=UPI000F7AE12C|nr:ABC transporter permease [Lacticaseibacillus daqingensis]